MDIFTFEAMECIELIILALLGGFVMLISNHRGNKN
jgi:hypothetical protein